MTALILAILVNNKVFLENLITYKRWEQSYQVGTKPGNCIIPII